jgi:hypothetical protein
MRDDCAEPRVYYIQSLGSKGDDGVDVQQPACTAALDLLGAALRRALLG